MKKIAMLGDLHGNLTATLAMEKALKDYHVDEIWFLGDAVGKGPQSQRDMRLGAGKLHPLRRWQLGLWHRRQAASLRITISGISWAKSA